MLCGCAQSLAAEVVRLEEQVLRLRSQELRVGREAEGATEVVRAMQSQLEAQTRERTGLLTELDALRSDNTELRQRLRAAEAAAAAAAAAAAQPHAYMAADAAPLKPPSATATPKAAAAEVASATAPPTAEAAPAAVAAAAEGGSSPAAAAAAPPSRDVSAALARAVLAQHAQHVGAGSEGAAEEEEGEEEEEEAVSPFAAVVPPELAALLPARAAELAGAGAADVASSDAVLGLVQSIYLLLSALEVDKQQLVAALGAKQVWLQAG